MSEIFRATFTVSPSLNEIHGNRWQMLNHKKKYLKQLKGYELYSLSAPVSRKILFCRYGSRELDNDNFIGGIKPLIDALKEKKIIWDDRREFFEPVHQQYKCKRGQERIIVTVFNKKDEASLPEKVN